MNKILRTSNAKHRTSSGLTLIEAVVAMAAACIVMLTAALLVSSGYRGWNQTFENANRESRLGALDSMIALGSIGRKSNKMNYCLYRVDGAAYTKAVPLVDPEEVVKGQAIEFRYWGDTELDADLMNPATTATAYALFYLDGDKLKVDYCPSYPPGGINSSGHRVTGAGVTTVTLAKNVTSVEFSHTTKDMDGDGKGCVRMKLVTKDPKDDSVKTTLAATLMRNVWPH
jgi:hypothetical protein